MGAASQARKSLQRKQQHISVQLPEYLSSASSQ